MLRSERWPIPCLPSPYTHRHSQANLQTEQHWQPSTSLHPAWDVLMPQKISPLHVTPGLQSSRNDGRKKYCNVRNLIWNIELKWNPQILEEQQFMCAVLLQRFCFVNSTWQLRRDISSTLAGNRRQQQKSNHNYYWTLSWWIQRVPSMKYYTHCKLMQRYPLHLIFYPVLAFALCPVPFLSCLHSLKKFFSIQYNHKLLYTGRKIYKTNVWGFDFFFF